MADALTAARELLDGFSPEQTEQWSEVREATNHNRKWIPNSGPQHAAFISEANELLFGGQAGPGKTDLILGLAFEQHLRSLIMRRQYTDMGALTERAIEINGTRDGYSGSNPMKMRPVGRNDQLIEFGAAAKLGDEKHWQGQPHDLIAFDEAVQFLEFQIKYLCGWNRSTVPEQRCRIVMATNPPITADGYWIIPMFAPWLDITYPNPAKDGELRWVVTDPDGKDMWVDGEHDIKEWNGKTYAPISRSFIHGELADNPYLIKTDYSKRLDQLPEPMRSAYRDGNFMAAREDTVNQAIPTAWVLEAQNRRRSQVPDGIPMCAMGVDASGGGQDPMIIAKRFDGWFDEMDVTPAEDIPMDKIGRYCVGVIIAQRRHEAKVIIDMGGGYGGSMYEILKENKIDPIPHKGAEKSTARTSDRNLGFFNKRSQVIWQFREALDPNQDGGSPIALPRDPELLADLTAPTFEIGGRGIQVESKEKVVARLGRSTDKGDAVVMAWSGGDRRLYQGRTSSRHAKPVVMTKKTQRGQKRRRR